YLLGLKAAAYLAVVSGPSSVLLDPITVAGARVSIIDSAAVLFDCGEPGFELCQHAGNSIRMCICQVVMLFGMVIHYDELRWWGWGTLSFGFWFLHDVLVCLGVAFHHAIPLHVRRVCRHCFCNRRSYELPGPVPHGGVAVTSGR